MAITTKIAWTALAVVSFIPAAHAGSITYLTTFNKTDNIYTNLNQEFPNTGPGVPGSGTGVPNATFLFDPATFNPAGLVAGSNLANNGIDFMLASNSTGQDFAESDFSTTNAPLTITSNVAGVTAAYLLTAAYFGVNFDVTFNGTGGATETFVVDSSLGGAPDFCHPDLINAATAQNGSLTNNVFDQTVLQVSDNTDGCGTGNTGLGGATVTNSLYEQTFLLNSSFAGQNLLSTVIQNTTPFNRGFDLLVFGETVAGASSSPSAPEPATGFLALGAFALAIVARRRRSN